MDGTTYTVNMVEAWGWMYIGVDRELPFDFVLELDGVRFDSNDASLASYTYAYIYMWASTDLSWRDGDTVAVRLLRALEDETAVNSAATGAPTIDGTAQVGQTLTAGARVRRSRPERYQAGLPYSCHCSGGQSRGRTSQGL